VIHIHNLIGKHTDIFNALLRVVFYPLSELIMFVSSNLFQSYQEREVDIRLMNSALV